MPLRLRVLIALAVLATALSPALFTPTDSARAEYQSPWNMIVNLDITTSTGQSTCTGFMIGPHTVGTAGHCLYDTGNGGWPTSVRVTPGVNGLDAPFASVYATGYTTTQAWAEQKDYRYDFGVVQLGTDEIGRATGWFDLAVLSDEELLRGAFTTAGYPADLPYQTLWALAPARPLSAVDASLVYFRWNVTHGQSGSPVFLSSNGRHRLAGLVNACRGNPCDETSVDFGVRITAPIADFFRAQVEERLQPSSGATPVAFTRPAGEPATLNVQGEQNAPAVLQRSADGIRWETVLIGQTDTTGRVTFDVVATSTAFYRGVVSGSGPTNPVRGTIETAAEPPLGAGESVVARR